MITILPVSHVAGKSRLDVAAACRQLGPELVALELDHARAYALLHPESQKVSWQQPKLALLTLALHGLQSHYSKKVGTKPGEEFLQAMIAAQVHGSSVAFIDQPINVTMNKLLRSMKLSDWFRLAGLAIAGGKIPFDLNSVPEEHVVNSMLREFKQQFPSIYRVLLTEREEYMATQLKPFKDQNTLLVVGAGHVPGLKRRLKDAEVWKV